MVRQRTQFSANPKLSHNQAIKQVIKNLTGTTTKGLILKPDTKKGIE